MAVAVVQFVDGVTSSGNNIGGTMANTTTGNTVVAIVNAFTGGAVTASAPTGTGMTFTKLFTSLPGTADLTCLEVWVAPNITGATTPTVGFTLSGSEVVGDLFLLELSGMPTTTTQDGTAATLTTNTSNSMVAPSITTTGSNTIIFSVFCPFGTGSAGEAGWTAKVGTSSSSIAQYKIFTSGQTGLVATATQTGGTGGAYHSAVFALKGAGGGPQQATASIGAGRTVTAASRVNRPGSTGVASSAAMLVASFISRRTSAGVSASAALSATAPVSHNAAGGIAALASLAATGKQMQGASGPLNAGATVGVVPVVIHKAAVAIQAKGSVNPLVPHFQQLTVGISTGATVSGTPNTVRTSGVGKVTIQAGAFFSKNAAFVIHSAIVQIFSGRAARFACTIGAKATLSLVATNRAASARVGIQTGLSPGTKTQANIVFLTRCQARASQIIKGSCSIAAHCGVVPAPVAVKVSFMASVSARSAMLALAQQLNQASVGAQAAAAVVANSNVITQALPVCVTGGKAIVAANGRVQRRASVALAGRAGVSDVGSVIWRSTQVPLGIRATVAASATVQHPVTIGILNAQAALAAMLTVKFSGSATVGAKGSLGLVAQVVARGQVGISASAAIGYGVGEGIDKQGVVTIAGRSGVTATARGIHSSADVIRPGAAVSVTPKVLKLSSVSVQAALRGLATPFKITTIPAITIVCGAHVSCAAQVVQSSANVIHGRASVAATALGLHQTNVGVQAAARMLAKGFMVTVAESVGMTSGSHMAVTAKVVHSAALHVLSGVTMTDSPHINKNASLNIVAHGTPTCGGRLSARASVGVAAGSLMLVGVQHEALARLGIAAGRTVVATGKVVGSATVNIVARGSASGSARLAILGVLSVMAGGRVEALGRKAVNLSATVRATAMLRAMGIDTFFGGSKTTVSKAGSTRHGHKQRPQIYDHATFLLTGEDSGFLCFQVLPPFPWVPRTGVLHFDTVSKCIANGEKIM